jgi:multidrug efflux pump subunit AcrA (membrane-fusion protein)
MNKLLMSLTLILLVSCLGQIQGDKGDSYEGHKHSSEKGGTSTYYTCSMHPKIKESKSGKCPICHMNLTKVEVELNDNSGITPKINKKDVWICKDYPEVESEVEETCPIDGTLMVLKPIANTASLVVAKVKLRKAQLNHFNPDYFPVSRMKMMKRIRLLGSVLQSEEKESSIPARVGGRVEKVYVKSTGSFVQVGDRVLELYSPKLITAGEEYLIAKSSYTKSKSSEFKDLLNQSEERLKLWGIKKLQYEKWFKEKKVPREITIYSPSTGIVRKRSATVGKYFKEGQNFFELSDLSDVWVEMDVYEQDSALVKLAQRVELEFTALPGENVQGEIDFVNPVLNQTSRTLKVRATIKNNSGKLKPGMIANAVLNIDIEGKPLVVPRSAIIDTGKRKVVWVKINEREFRAKKVHSGHESDGYVEIKNGLEEGEEVVIEGSFLLDAQAQLFGGYEDMKVKESTEHKH